MSHTRINFVPANLAVMFLIGVGCIWGIASTERGLTTNHTPIKASVNDLVTKPGLQDKYVTVTGAIEPDMSFQWGKKKPDGSFDVTHTWVMMLDKDNPRGIFVEVPEEEIQNKKERSETITGTWETMSPELSGVIAKHGLDKMSATIETTYMLSAGDAPPSTGLAAIATAAAGLLLAAFLITLFKQYVIFRALPAATRPDIPAQNPSHAPQRVYATGEFTLPPHGTRRFLNVPARPVALESGHFAFVSNIDASSRFMGITTANRQGLWSIVLTPASVRNVTPGTLYLGTAPRPALEFQFSDAQSNIQRKATLSFDTEPQRDFVAAELNRMSSRPVPV